MPLMYYVVLDGLIARELFYQNNNIVFLLVNSALSKYSLS